MELDNSFVREEKQEVQVEKQHRELPADFNALLGDERIDELEELKKKEET